MKQKIMLVLAVLLLCVACHEKKDYSKLPPELAKLCQQIDKDDKNPENYFLRYQYYLENGQPEAALNDLLQCIKLKGDEPKYHVALADYYFSQNKTDDAEESLQKAIQIDPKCNEAYLKLAELYFHLKMFSECNTTLDDALKVQNHNPRAHLIRAFLLKEQGDTTGCVRMLQLTIDQDPKEVKAFLELGYIYQMRKDPLAITYYQNALAVDPTNEEINFNLALLYQDLGDLENAKNQYNKILSFDSDNLRALFNLGYVVLIYDKNYDEAISYFSKVLETEPDYVEALTNRAIAFEENKQYEEARADYQMALKLDPHYASAIAGMNRMDKKSK